MKDHVGAYLARYAEPEIACAALARKNYRWVLVVPMYDEPPAALSNILPKTASDLLVIGVCNVPESAANTPAQQRTLALCTALGAEPGRPATLVQHRPGIDLLVIDRASERLIPTRQGVGLARKIGADIALALIEDRRIQEPRIHCTDADATLPEGYFEANYPVDSSAPDRRHTPVAFTYPFTHHSANPDLHLRGQLYELYLRYYRDQLDQAGSRYAFHALGSSLSIDAVSYAKVRGFPRRAAGEDFYLLNKLAKLGTIATPRMPPIRLEARPSTRVPFGTGPSLAHIPADAAHYRVFQPSVFDALARAIARVRGGRISANDTIGRTLIEMGAAAIVERAVAQFNQLPQRHRALDDWFDGLRSLQFLRRTRAAGWPDQPLLESLGCADTVSANASAEELMALNDALRRKEQTRTPAGTFYD